jgi:hypothetical protein
VGTAILVPFIYTHATRSVSADSGTDGKLHNNHNKETFGLPSTMLFSKRLTVMAVEQMNHDTKRITFALPGGLEESSGVPVSGEPRLKLESSLSRGLRLALIHTFVERFCPRRRVQRRFRLDPTYPSRQMDTLPPTLQPDSRSFQARRA